MGSIIVSGATGFIGKHVVQQLSTSGHVVTGMNSRNGDIADETTWQNLPSADIVIHLASRTFVPDSWHDPSGFIRTNLYGTVCCLEYCRKHKARLIYLSSYLYGNPTQLPIPESANMVANNPYGLSKKLAEDSCAFYFNSFGVESVILRPFNVYGPGQSTDFLLPMVIDQVLSGQTICVKDLKPKRDYVYIEDLVTAIVSAVGLTGFHIFNIGSGKSYSVSEIIELVQKIAGTSLNIESTGEQRQGEIMDTRADVSKALEIMGWSPAWTMEMGIEKTVSEMKTKHAI